LQVELTEPIVAGVRYEVVFHVSLADKLLYAVSTLGAYFSDTQIVRNEYSIADLGLVPQVSSAEGMVFDDKENWMGVRDTFDSRYGGERFITIGNFNLDDASGVVFVGNGDHDYTHAYYYIDDVSVIALDSIPSSVSGPGQEMRDFAVYPNPSNGDMTLKYSLAEGERGSLKVFNLLGGVILEVPLAPSDTVSDFNLQGLESGIYLIRVDVNSEQRLTERIVVIRE
jgi:hypothetical protein